MKKTTTKYVCDQIECHESIETEDDSFNFPCVKDWIRLLDIIWKEQPDIKGPDCETYRYTDLYFCGRKCFRIFLMDKLGDNDGE